MRVETELPDITVAIGNSRLARVDRTVSMVGDGLSPTHVTGLSTLSVRNGWKVAAPDWQLRFARAPHAGDGRMVRGELADVATARGDDGRWICRGTFWLSQTAATDWRAKWRTPVNVLAMEVDGGWLPPPSDLSDAATFSLMADGRGHRVRMVWTAVSDGPPSTADVPMLTANDQPVSMPVLWTVVAPSTSVMQPDSSPLPAVAASLYRASAQVRLAEEARGGGATAKDAARAFWAGAAIELRRAEGAIVDASDLLAGPNGKSLAEWHRQLAEAIRTASPTNGARLEEATLPYDDAFNRGSPSAWFMPAGDDGPRIAWPAADSQWTVPIVRTAAIVFTGCLAVWLGRRFGTPVWPEQWALIGTTVLSAGGGVLGWAPVIAGVAARAFLSGRAALRQWRPERSSNADTIKPAGAGA